MLLMKISSIKSTLTKLNKFEERPNAPAIANVQCPRVALGSYSFHQDIFYFAYNTNRIIIKSSHNNASYIAYHLITENINYEPQYIMAQKCEESSGVWWNTKQQQSLEHHSLTPKKKFGTSSEPPKLSHHISQEIELKYSSITMHQLFVVVT